jgi:hypothetical protein
VTSQDLPRPITTDHKILTALVGRLDAQNELLKRILDRLPEPAAPADAKGTVELREPAPPAMEREPEPAPEPTPQPAAPARRTRKTTSKGKTPGKGSA